MIYLDPYDLGPGDVDLLTSVLEPLGHKLGLVDNYQARRVAYRAWWNDVTGDPANTPFPVGGRQGGVRDAQYGWYWQLQGSQHALIGLPAAAHIALAAILMEIRGRLRPELAAAASMVWANEYVQRLKGSYR